MPRMHSETTTVTSEDLHAAYGAYKLRIAQNYIYVLAIFASLFSVLLIVFDLKNITDQTVRLAIAVVRYMYAVLLIFVGGWLTRLKSFRTYTYIVSALELASIAINLYVFVNYQAPNFLIQSMGLVATVLILYLVPNRKSFQLGLSIIASLSFYGCAFLSVTQATLNEILASVVYTLVAIALCSISSYHNEKNQLGEFISKTRLEQLSTTDFNEYRQPVSPRGGGRPLDELLPSPEAAALSRICGCG